MSDEEVGEVRCTPTGPGLEFGLFEAVRLRLVEALTRRDYDPIHAERNALRLVQGVRLQSAGIGAGCIKYAQISPGGVVRW